MPEDRRDPAHKSGRRVRPGACDTMSPEIRVVSNAALEADLRTRVLALCSEAYEEDFSAYFELLRGGTHVLAFESGELVSHAAWVERELRVGAERRPLATAYVEAVATATRWQRRGLATVVLRSLPPLLHGFALAALSPSNAAFYTRLGWEMWQGPLFYREADRRIATPDEEVMIHRLPKTPPDLDLRDELETDWRPVEVW